MTIDSHATDHDLNHDDHRLMSITEVADLVRAPVATVRYWRHLGTGPHGFRVGRSVRFWRSEVVRWLNEQSRLPKRRGLLHGEVTT